MILNEVTVRLVDQEHVHAVHRVNSVMEARARKPGNDESPGDAGAFLWWAILGSNQ
ncbi:hypothetical protein [Agromyces sp. Root81]|uniref:hypothetical protein n=1 Tax=Agromyces sp. Root81 TaxID=1736601 RepID=UPI0012FC9E69|nr:hypothetical protein [Agromyces sp. Root81]